MTRVRARISECCNQLSDCKNFAAHLAKELSAASPIEAPVPVPQVRTPMSNANCTHATCHKPLQQFAHGPMHMSRHMSVYAAASARARTHSVCVVCLHVNRWFLATLHTCACMCTSGSSFAV